MVHVYILLEILWNVYVHVNMWLTVFGNILFVIFECSCSEICHLCVHNMFCRTKWNTLAGVLLYLTYMYISPQVPLQRQVLFHYSFSLSYILFSRVMLFFISYILFSHIYIFQWQIVHPPIWNKAYKMPYVYLALTVLHNELWCYY